MAERKRSYKQVSLESEITASQDQEELASLNEPWQPQKTRLRTANILAFGLLILFGLTIACSGVVIAALIIGNVNSTNGLEAEELQVVIQETINFVTKLLPFIATPLGVALGYYFREPPHD